MSEDMMCKYSDFFALLPAVGSGCVCACACVCWVPAGPYQHPKESCVLECQGMDVLVDTSRGFKLSHSLTLIFTHFYARPHILTHA